MATFMDGVIKGQLDSFLRGKSDDEILALIQDHILPRMNQQQKQRLRALISASLNPGPGTPAPGFVVPWGQQEHLGRGT